MAMKRQAIEAAIDAMLDAGLELERVEIRTRIDAIYKERGIEYQQVFDDLLPLNDPASPTTIPASEDRARRTERVTGQRLFLATEARRYFFSEVPLKNFRGTVSPCEKALFRALPRNSALYGPRGVISSRGPR